LDPTQNAKEEMSEKGGEVLAIAALWNVQCAKCHGRDGVGKGTERPQNAQMPDFSHPQWQSSRSDRDLTQTIEKGHGQMPGFEEQLGPSPIKALVDFIRDFGKAEKEP